MTQSELLIAAIIASVAKGQRTVSQLRRQHADGLAYKERFIKLASAIVDVLEDSTTPATLADLLNA